VFEDTSNKLLKRNEFESKLYQHFPTSDSGTVKKTKGPLNQTADLIDEVMKFVLCVVKSYGFSGRAACRLGGHFAVPFSSALTVSLYCADFP